MKYPLCFGIVICLVCGAFLFAQSSPSSTIHSYRHELSTRSQEPKFADEISPADRGSVTTYEVETDAQGRTTKVAVIRHGQKLSERFYRFATGAKLPGEYDRFVAGEKTGVVRIQRDKAGNRIREDYLTADGTLARYEVYSYSRDQVEDTHYAAHGKKTRYDILSYSAKDTLIRDLYYHGALDPLNYVDIEFDDGTGLRTSSKGFKDGKLIDISRYTYNADGDVVRNDFYDANHKWSSADEFSDGLRTRRIYLVWGATRELQYTYDEKRWLKESVLYYKGDLVCRFVYDRLPDGTAKQTRALGPDGKPWADYPDMEVSDVKVNGEALAGESVVHKTGNWWNGPSTTPEGGVEVLSDTQGVDFGPYMTRIVQIVRQNWYNLMPPQVYPPIFKLGKVLLEFSVLKDGKVEGMRIHTSSGDVALDRAAWGSITASLPAPTAAEGISRANPRPALPFLLQSRTIHRADRRSCLARSGDQIAHGRKAEILRLGTGRDGLHRYMERSEPRLRSDGLRQHFCRRNLHCTLGRPKSCDHNSSSNLSSRPHQERFHNGGHTTKSISVAAARAFKR